jgi:hypothetical protein
MSENELKKVENDQQNFLNIIKEVALNPDVNIEKMTKILDMQERILDKQAKTEFNQSMALAMVQIPSIERDSQGQSNKFAAFENINKIVKPIIAEHGLFITFRTEFQSDDFLLVTAKITHKSGHSEETSMRFPFDNSGNKNDIQAVGSSISYGKRYTLGALLGIATHGEDDDGFSTSKTIGEKEIIRLNNGLDKADIKLAVLCEYMDVERLSDIKVDKFNNAIVYLTTIINKVKK